LHRESNHERYFDGTVVGCGWGMILLSAGAYLLFWRVDNEPGARPVPSLLWLAIAFCSVGGLAFLGSQVRLIMQKAWLALGIGWVLCIALLVGAISLAPILLLLMV
jgi:hypothetical protein